MRQDLQTNGNNPPSPGLMVGLQKMVRSLPEPKHAGLPALISLSGKMGSGKDTVGALLSMVGYNCVSWAGALKLEAFRSLCDSIAPVGMTPEVRQAWCTMEPEDIYRKPTSANARKVLQWWGTEYRRSQDPLYWIKALHKSLAPGTLYAITDTRFANEDEYVHGRGGQSWMITRPDASQATGIAGHASHLPHDIRSLINQAGSLRQRRA